MKRTRLFILVSSISLLIILFIQVNWIMKTAQNKEEIFNEKTRIILARTTESLSEDLVTSKILETSTGRNERKKIDSLLRYYMRYYNFKARYSFEVIRSLPPVPMMIGPENKYEIKPKPEEQACYDQSLDKMKSKNGWELQLIFPDKEELLRTEMRMPFIISVILILVVIFLFFKTVSSLLKEKKISEHTTEFLNNMTHEFKTPLTNIALAGKMIAKDSSAKQEEKLKHYAGIILEENEKLRLQVEQVLSLTALERGEIPFQKTELDLHQLIQNCLKPISLQIENINGKLLQELNAEKFIVLGDLTHLSNAISNLIDNAIKYSGENPEIQIATLNQANQIILKISDNGIGIEKEYQKKVFEKYFRVPTGNIHDVKGFGLGLAYVKKIIELHDGTIDLQSEAGTGTTFTITLPNA